jgi:hypothetical protein
MSAKFTPGPWVAEKPRWYAPTDERHVYDTQGQLIARIPLAGRFQSVNEAIANANIIKAAPNLYYALDKLFCVVKGEIPGGLSKVVYDALAEARGEA